VGVPNAPAVLPGFLIIGAPRCATRWLRSNLSQHPQIFMPPYDLGFFDDASLFRKPGLLWYAKQFQALNDERLVGESTPTYLARGTKPLMVASRIDVTLPDVRLVAIVRQPVERMYSAMLHHIKRGRLSPRSDLFAMVRDERDDVAELDLIGAGLYAENLAPYRRLFDDRLLLVVYDDIRDRPEVAFRSVLTHIGADPDFVPLDLDQVLFSNRRSVRARPVSPAQHRRLYSLFRDDVEELGALLGRDMGDWDPGPPDRKL
jgi:Sulfotransferase domain